MPRRTRVIAAGVPHHITHRGNNRQEVFLLVEDRRRYQELLMESLEICSVSLLGWCWMSNHVHLIAVPRSEGSLSRLVMRVHSRYAQEFNRGTSVAGTSGTAAFTRVRSDAAICRRRFGTLI